MGFLLPLAGLIMFIVAAVICKSNANLASIDHDEDKKPEKETAIDQSIQWMNA